MKFIINVTRIRWFTKFCFYFTKYLLSENILFQTLTGLMTYIIPTIKCKHGCSLNEFREGEGTKTQFIYRNWRKYFSREAKCRLCTLQRTPMDALEQKRRTCGRGSHLASNIIKKDYLTTFMFSVMLIKT